MTIYSALKAFKEKYPRERIMEIEHLKDKRGVFGFVVKNTRQSTYAVFCFKSSMNGGEVSVHEEIFKRAKEKAWPIILSVDGTLYYKFLPGDIEKKNWPNERYGVTMINFPITAGHSLQRPEEEHPIINKMKSELDLQFVPSRVEEQSDVTLSESPSAAG
jgi:hypothetical protein